MTEIEVSVPGDVDLQTVDRVVVESAKALGLECRQDGELKRYPGSRHWHFASSGKKGTLEVTLWEKKHRLWLSTHDNRNAEWISEAIVELKSLIEARLLNVISTEQEPLLDLARKAAEDAYCPYSNFPVGAIVRTDIGDFSGCNIENASYGLAVCAERVALFKAVSEGATEIKMLAVSCIRATDSDPPGSRMPCGACRQVISEFMPPDGIVMIDGVGKWRVDELLPQPFVLAERPFEKRSSRR